MKYRPITLLGVPWDDHSSYMQGTALAPPRIRTAFACPFARIMETGRIHRLVQVGIRCMNGHQKAQAEKFGVEVHEMKDWQGPLKFSFDGPLYISFFDLPAADKEMG